MGEVEFDLRELIGEFYTERGVPHKFDAPNYIALVGVWPFINVRRGFVVLHELEGMMK